MTNNGKNWASNN